jgi:hypothetical protein
MSEDRHEEQIAADARWRRKAADPNDPYGKDRAMTETDVRPLHTIAHEIADDWPNPYFGAEPYILALGQLDKITDPYYNDDGTDVVIRFLINAASWKGPVARRIKAELKAMLSKQRARR